MSVYGQDAYTLLFFMLLINVHIPTVPSNAQSRKVRASMRSPKKYAHIDAQSRKVGADKYPTKLLFLRMLGALECAVCEQQ